MYVSIGNANSLTQSFVGGSNGCDHLFFFFNLHLTILVGNANQNFFIRSNYGKLTRLLIPTKMLNSVKLLILKKIIIKRLIDLQFAAIYRMPQFFLITQSIRECSLKKKKKSENLNYGHLYWNARTRWINIFFYFIFTLSSLLEAPTQVYLFIRFC